MQNSIYKIKYCLCLNTPLRLPPTCVCNLRPGHTVLWSLRRSCTQHASPSPSCAHWTVTYKQQLGKRTGRLRQTPKQPVGILSFLPHSEIKVPLSTGDGKGGGEVPAPFPTYDKTGWNVTLTIHLHIEPPSTLVSSSGVCRINTFHSQSVYR